MGSKFKPPRVLSHLENPTVHADAPVPQWVREDQQLIKSPWAVLLCKFSDDATEPFTRDYYEDLFTSSGTGSQNMVDFFRDVSHDLLDLSDSKVYGWYTLDKKISDYGLTGAEKLANRQNLINWARQAAAAGGDTIAPGNGVVVCMNVPTDLFGGSSGVVCDSNSTDPRFLGQEMGHFYGLDHSRADTIQPCGEDSEIDYKDFWDVMSTAGCAFSAPHARYGLIGPGLNAANMAGRGWLDESRVWKASDSAFDNVVQLRPLHRRDLPGYLAARIGKYIVEFRNRSRWDAEIPRPAVLVHRFVDNHSYIGSGHDGQQDLVAGAIFGTPDSSVSETTRVEVIEINSREEFASIRLVHRPAFREPSAGGVLFGGVAKGGSGHILVPGRGFVPIPPHSPSVGLLELIAAYEATEGIASLHLRSEARRDALSAISSLAGSYMKQLRPFEQPAPVRNKRRNER